MLGRSSGNHDWLIANASACVSCGFRLRNARNASDCVWMETGLYVWYTSSSSSSVVIYSAPVTKLKLEHRCIYGAYLHRIFLVCVWCLFAGVVRCEVEYGDDGNNSYVDSAPYDVIALPSVSVNPVVASVFIGQTLTIKCQLTSDLSNTSHIYWLKDGRRLTKREGLSPNYHALSVGVGSMFESVCLSVCPEHKSKWMIPKCSNLVQVMTLGYLRSDVV